MNVKAARSAKPTFKVPPLFGHQKQSRNVLKKCTRVFDTSDPGCVSADTEFLTPTGWKRIDQYTEGDQVAQFHPGSREIEFVAPLAYVKRPCPKMIAIAPSRGTSQRLSHEHRVLFYRSDGSYGVMSAAEYMAGLHFSGPHRHNAKFCTTFSVMNSSSLDWSDIQLRLMVAVIADGHFPSPNTTRCVVRLKKKRKITRMQELLVAARVLPHIRFCKSSGYTVFSFDAPWQCKEFGHYWWSASQAQLEIIADEVCYWDSAERKADATTFSTFSNESADFIQYAFSAAKRPASLTTSVRDRRDEGRGVMQEFSVHAASKDKLVGPGRASSVYEVPNPEGFKYCFEVPTSFLLLRHNGYIFATGNTGKTRVEVEDFADRRRAGGGCALVLATKSLLESAWKNDFEKFAPDMGVSIAYATNREKAFEADADVYVTNHDAAKWLAAKPKSFFKKFDTIIIDESTAYKHGASQRSRAVAKIVKYFEYRRLLTGTPNSNGICDIWHQVFLLDDGKRLGKSFFQFRSAACIPEQVGPSANMIQWRDRPGIEATVSAMIRDITIRHKFEDCVDIPANHMYSVPFKLSKKHMAQYNEMQNFQILELKKTTVTAVNGAVVAGKLLQIASGATYNDDGDYSLIDSDRYTLILDLVEERAHSIVFFHWEHQREELIKEAKKRGVTYAVYDGSTPDKLRTQIVKDYQDGKYQVLFAHPQSAGHGLTLTRGTATIWASPTHNLEHFLQGLKRVHRIGQTEKTETIVVIAEGTIDEKVWDSLQAKSMKMTDLLEGLM